MTERMAAIREVFGVPDVFTVRPSTFGEIDPIAEALGEQVSMAAELNQPASLEMDVVAQRSRG